MSDTRAARPDALLAQANREARGRLKVFLGAAPGVGKTYAMLEDAARRARAGEDVVAALVETHGRAETAALLAPLERLPRKAVPYRGRTLDELDLDALLARRPRLALIDELAHTNVPGSRHPKRWQDVEEVLDAGIDVVTTLNVQHIESLNDVVARITGVRVAETVPDAVLGDADAVEVIDLSSEELIARLQSGRVYREATIGRALDNFFTKGNLTALRELALRTAASHVDAEMRAVMSATAVPGPWPADDRLMVCVNEAPAAKTAVRTAKRMAERAGIPWIAVTVVTPRHEALGEPARRATVEAMQLAESLGAETETLHAESGTVTELVAFARAANVSRIVVARARPRLAGNLLANLFGSLRRDRVFLKLLDAARDFEVTVVSSDGARGPARLPKPAVRVSLPALAASLGVTAAATLLGLLIDRLGVVDSGSLSVVYLVGVLAVGTRLGLLPSLVASVASFLAYNFFFTPPLFTFAVSRSEDVVALVLFLLGAVSTGSLAGRLRAQIQSMRASQRQTAALYDFSRKIAPLSKSDDVLYAAAFHIAATLDCRSLILMPDERGVLQQVQGYPTIADDLDARAQGAARWAFEKNDPAGAGTQTLPASSWLFVPLATSKPLGVLGVQFHDPRRLDPETKRLLFAVEDQVAVAVERTRLAADLQRLHVAAEGGRLRTALLNSLSHDLRTPLVSVIGALSSLSDTQTVLKPAEREDLTQTALGEALRLDRFVQNLLDMTRLEYGALALKRVPTDLAEIVGTACADLKSALADRALALDLPRDLPLVGVDPVLVGQALVNVLDNAVKHTPPGSGLSIRARAEGDAVVLTVADEGPGVPESERDKVFDPFFRVSKGDRSTAGTGLGLAIVRGFVDANGGRVAIETAPGGGASVVMRLPAVAADSEG